MFLWVPLFFSGVLLFFLTSLSVSAVRMKLSSCSVQDVLFVLSKHFPPYILKQYHLMDGTDTLLKACEDHYQILFLTILAWKYLHIKRQWHPIFVSLQHYNVICKQYVTECFEIAVPGTLLKGVCILSSCLFPTKEAFLCKAGSIWCDALCVVRLQKKKKKKGK